jgi:hypothetical protein
VKLSEYYFIVEHRPNIGMRHAEALSRCVSEINKELALTRDIIEEEQIKDMLCERYRQQETL